MRTGTTLDHVTIITDDFEASRSVYDAVFASLGLAATVDYEDPEGEDADPDTVAAVGYADTAAASTMADSAADTAAATSIDARPILLLVAGAHPTTGAHVAIGVATAEEVDAAYLAARTAAARIVQPPRAWEARQLSYYGLQFADPAGNVIEIVLRDQSTSL